MTRKDRKRLKRDEKRANIQLALAIIDILLRIIALLNS